ncbi:hypothetical protein ACKWMZ_28145 [Pseudomonas protegens]|uniref:hypothetical protein n=1 Tax=Pseudomonas protegens TaxID=380021 RepID=UPI003966EBAC
MLPGAEPGQWPIARMKNPESSNSGFLRVAAKSAAGRRNLIIRSTQRFGCCLLSMRYGSCTRARFGVAGSCDRFLPRAPLFDLLACADQRIRVLHKLVNSLSCMTAQAADASDLFQIADIASLLLGDGVALLDVAQGRAMESADRAS